MLYSSGRTNKITGFVDTPEVDNIADFIGSQRGYPNAFYYQNTSMKLVNLKKLTMNLTAYFRSCWSNCKPTTGSASYYKGKLKLGYKGRSNRDQLEARNYWHITKAVKRSINSRSNKFGTVFVKSKRTRKIIILWEQLYLPY